VFRVLRSCPSLELSWLRYRICRRMAVEHSIRSSDSEGMFPMTKRRTQFLIPFLRRVPRMRSFPWLLTTLVVAVPAMPQDVSNALAKAPHLPKIQLNDNHQPAGSLHDHVLALSLIARCRSQDHSYGSQSVVRCQAPFSDRQLSHFHGESQDRDQGRLRSSLVASARQGWS
jgi:hypothetical protein